MKKKILTLFVVLCIAISHYASNVITYQATEKLKETTDCESLGLHTDAFNVSISSHTFSNGTGTITFSGEVTNIGFPAFYGCGSLTSVTIPNSVTIIGMNAFSYCRGLKSVIIPDSVTSIGSSAFSGCSGLTSVTIPNSVKSIGDYAFESCSSLTSITIPNSVTSIGEDAFGEGSGLTSINVDAANKNYASMDGVLFNYAKDTLIQYPIRNTRASYAIPNSVTSIGKNAFLCCSSLTSITIPNSVTSIGDGAFKVCGGLTSVTIGNSVKSIGNGAFCYCSGLTSVTIPNSVTSIGMNAFSYCRGLADIYSYDTIPPTANDNTFNGVSKHCYIHVPAGTMRYYQLAIGWNGFYHFFEISSIPGGGDSTKVSVTVTNNYATFSWPVNPTASSYNLEIKKDGELFCTLVFNTMGQLVGMAFAPSRAEGTSSSAAEQTAYGYSFVVSNLESNSHYDFTFITKDSEGQTIESHKGTFQTGTATALEETLSGNDQGGATKFVKDGILYILHDGKTYNAQGQEAYRQSR